MTKEELNKIGVNLSLAEVWAKGGEGAIDLAEKIVELTKKEKEDALNKAVDEAVGAFNRCPVCHHLVCDHCFMICDDIDMCSSCATRLQERGEPVLQCV